MIFDFSQKNIIVTGGSSGIGKALVKKLSKLGANLWIIARDEKKILDLKNEMGSNNAINYFLVDVQNYAALIDIAQKFKVQNIKLHGLINSAGVAHPAEFDALEADLYRWLMEVNYFGTLNCVLAFSPLLVTGSFISNISSMAGLVGVYGYAGYGASKFAVRGFTDVIRSELKMRNIHVSIVFPPDTDTPQLEYENHIKPAITKKVAGSAKIMTADKVADEIIFGIQRKKYLIIPGFESKVIYHLSNILGPLFYPIMDIMVAQAAKELSHKK